MLQKMIHRWCIKKESINQWMSLPVYLAAVLQPSERGPGFQSAKEYFQCL